MLLLRSIRISLALFVFITGVVLSLPVLSQSNGWSEADSLTVKPALIELEVNGGDILSKTITITNNYSTSVAITAQIKGFVSASKFGGVNFIDDNQNSAQSWLAISPQQVDIPAKSSVDFLINIRVPDGTPPGSYYAAIIFIPDINIKSVAGSGANVVPAVGALFLFNVSSPEKIDINKISIVNGRIKSERSFLSAVIRKIEGWLGNQEVAVITKPRVEIEFEISNQTNFYIRPSAEVTLGNIFGRVVAKDAFELNTVLSNSQRFNAITVDLSPRKMPYAGRYNVYLDLVVEGEELSKVLIVWILPVWFLLSTIALFCLIIFFVVKYKTRIVRFFSILLRGK